MFLAKLLKNDLRHLVLLSMDTTNYRMCNIIAWFRVYVD